MTAENNGFQFDTNGRLQVVSKGAAVLPVTYINGIKFDAQGRVVVSP